MAYEMDPLNQNPQDVVEEEIPTNPLEEYLKAQRKYAEEEKLAKEQADAYKVDMNSDSSQLKGALAGLVRGVGVGMAEYGKEGEGSRVAKATEGAYDNAQKDSLQVFLDKQKAARGKRAEGMENVKSLIDINELSLKGQPKAVVPENLKIDDTVVYRDGKAYVQRDSIDQKTGKVVRSETFERGTEPKAPTEVINKELSKPAPGTYADHTRKLKLLMDTPQGRANVIRTLNTYGAKSIDELPAKLAEINGLETEHVAKQLEGTYKTVTDNMARSTPSEAEMTAHSKSVGASASLDNLETALLNSDPNATMKQDQIKNSVAGYVKSLTGIDIMDQNMDAIARQTAMDTAFNQYRKEITGAAAAVQELASLKAVYPNSNDTVQQALVKVKVLKQEMDLLNKVNLANKAASGTIINDSVVRDPQLVALTEAFGSGNKDAINKAVRDVKVSMGMPVAQAKGQAAASPKTQTDNDKARKWLEANPNHPNAAAVRAKLGN